MARKSKTVSPSVLFSTDIDVSSSIATNRSRNFGRHPIWIDTDVGFDDLVAIGCCHGAINNVEEFTGGSNIGKAMENIDQAIAPRLVGISTVRGGLTPDPSDCVAILKGLLPSKGPSSIPIVAGEGNALNEKNSSYHKVDDPSWLALCRQQMNEFCSFEGITFVSNVDEEENTRSNTGNKKSDGVLLHTTMVEASAERFFDFESNCDKMDLVCLGPLTNLAQWLDEIPDFCTNRLNAIWILGGNIPVCRSFTSSLDSNGDGESLCVEDITVEAEFNFARDPEAVRTVLHHAALQNTTIHIVPQEVCDRKAFEDSFSFEEKASAANIIEDWLQSNILSSKTQYGLESLCSKKSPSPTNKVDSIHSATPSVESLLPTWMVRLIRKRTFSVYGDPICLYARHISGSAAISEAKNSRKTKSNFLWKKYSTKCTTSGKIEEVLSVDSDGRLILCNDKSSENTGSKSGKIVSTSSKKGGDSKPYEEKNAFGTIIYIAAYVELGQSYMDWLAKSLISSFRES